MNALYMLDTDSASYLIRGGFPLLDQRIAALPPDRLCISVITRAELLYGLRLNSGAHRIARLVNRFLANVHSLAWGDDAAGCYSVLAASLTQAGAPIGVMDALIAAHALAAPAVLVTNNVRHFGRISGLKTENWTRP